MFFTSIKMSLANLKRNKSRFSLSVIGVSVGVLLAITTIILSQSFKYKMITEMKQTNETNITMAFTDQSNKLNYVVLPLFNDSNINTIKKVEHVQSVNGMVVFRTQDKIQVQKHKDASTKLLVANAVEGVDSTYIKELGVKLSKGTLFSDESEAVIGGQIAKSGDISVGDSITLKINGVDKKFKISGIIGLQPKTPFSDFGSTIDNMIAISKNNFPGASYSAISVKIDDEKNLGIVGSELEKRVGNEPNIKAALVGSNYKVAAVSQNDVISLINQWFQYINLFIFGLCFLASIIAAVGVVNVMLITIYERFKEIGIMKALGASNQQVSIIYVTESCIIGTIGTSIGIVFGVLINALAIKLLGWKLLLPPSIIVIILLLGIGTTLLGGLIPARKASKLDPNEALMTE